MNAVFIPARTRISVDRYQKMVAAGVLTKYDRIELIEGEMIDKAPIGSKHAASTARLTRLLNIKIGDAAIVSPGGPVNLGDFSEPQPDVMLLKHRDDFYNSKIPEASDVLLVIEISDSTLAYDQSTKLNLYARYGVPEYWILDITGQRIIAHRNPTTAGYGSKLEYRARDSVSPQALPSISIVVRDALP